MRSIRAKNVVAIVALIIVVTGVGVLIFRPELVPVEHFRAGIKVIIDSLPGSKAETASSGSQSKTATGDQVPVKKDMYLIELKSGGRVYADNLKTGDGTLSYETDKGLLITINSSEVVGVRKFQEGEEPVR